MTARARRRSRWCTHQRTGTFGVAKVSSPGEVSLPGDVSLPLEVTLGISSAHTRRSSPQSARSWKTLPAKPATPVIAPVPFAAVWRFTGPVLERTCDAAINHPPALHPELRVSRLSSQNGYAQDGPPIMTKAGNASPRGPSLLTRSPSANQSADPAGERSSQFLPADRATP